LCEQAVGGVPYTQIGVVTEVEKHLLLERGMEAEGAGEVAQQPDGHVCREKGKKEGRAGGRAGGKRRVSKEQRARGREGGREGGGGRTWGTRRSVDALRDLDSMQSFALLYIMCVQYEAIRCFPPSLLSLPPSLFHPLPSFLSYHHFQGPPVLGSAQQYLCSCRRLLPQHHPLALHRHLQEGLEHLWCDG